VDRTHDGDRETNFNPSRRVRSQPSRASAGAGGGPAGDLPAARRSLAMRDAARGFAWRSWCPAEPERVSTPAYETRDGTRAARRFVRAPKTCCVVARETSPIASRAKGQLRHGSRLNARSRRVLNEAQRREAFGAEREGGRALFRRGIRFLRGVGNMLAHVPSGPCSRAPRPPPISSRSAGVIRDPRGGQLRPGARPAPVALLGPRRPTSCKRAPRVHRGEARRGDPRARASPNARSNMSPYHFAAHVSSSATGQAAPPCTSPRQRMDQGEEPARQQRPSPSSRSPRGVGYQTQGPHFTGVFHKHCGAPRPRRLRAELPRGEAPGLKRPRRLPCRRPDPGRVLRAVAGAEVEGRPVNATRLPDTSDTNARARAVAAQLAAFSGEVGPFYPLLHGPESGSRAAHRARGGAGRERTPRRAVTTSTNADSNGPWHSSRELLARRARFAACAVRLLLDGHPQPGGFRGRHHRGDRRPRQRRGAGLFNPFRPSRTRAWLDLLSDFARVNRRMHKNKVRLTADGQASIHRRAPTSATSTSGAGSGVVPSSDPLDVIVRRARGGARDPPRSSTSTGNSASWYPVGRPGRASGTRARRGLRARAPEGSPTDVDPHAVHAPMRRSPLGKPGLAQGPSRRSDCPCFVGPRTR